MANPHKGEVEFKADGKVYTLRYSANALCDLEDHLDRGVVEISAEMASWEKQPNKIRFSFIRAIFWAGLRDHHPDIDIKAAGELIIAAGGVLAGFTLVADAFAVAFPNAETKGSRPPTRSRASRGTGPVS